MPNSAEAAKTYEVDGLTFEFTPNGSPFEGMMMVMWPEAPFGSYVNLTKLGSRAIWAKGAAELYDADIIYLKRALNEICTLRTEEVAAATEGEKTVGEEPDVPTVADEQVDELVGRPGVLNRYVEDAARMHSVVGERPILKLHSGSGRCPASSLSQREAGRRQPHHQGRARARKEPRM